MWVKFLLPNRRHLDNFVLGYQNTTANDARV